MDFFFLEEVTEIFINLAFLKISAGHNGVKFFHLIYNNGQTFLYAGVWMWHQQL